MALVAPVASEMEPKIIRLHTQASLGVAYITTRSGLPAVELTLFGHAEGGKLVARNSLFLPPDRVDALIEALHAVTPELPRRRRRRG